MTGRFTFLLPSLIIDVTILDSIAGRPGARAAQLHIVTVFLPPVSTSIVILILIFNFVILPLRFENETVVYPYSKYFVLVYGDNDITDVLA
jgi:hypothetical protein